MFVIISALSLSLSDWVWATLLEMDYRITGTYKQVQQYSTVGFLFVFFVFMCCQLQMRIASSSYRPPFLAAVDTDDDRASVASTACTVDEGAGCDQNGTAAASVGHHDGVAPSGIGGGGRGGGGEATGTRRAKPTNYDPALLRQLQVQ